MMDQIMDAATRMQSHAVLDWKNKGGKIVGYTCSYVPAEILYAADILPVRIRGSETESMEIGDAYFGPFICSYPKCILQMVGDGKFSFLDGAIITPGCDSMRRLDECWRNAGNDIDGIVPSFFYYFDVPHKTAPHGMKWFEGEISKLIAGIEAHFGVIITEEKLKGAIHLYNKSIPLLNRLEDFRTGSGVFLSGTDAFAVHIAGTVIHRKDYNKILEELIGELEKRKKSLSEGKKRIMVIGSVSDDISLTQLVEAAGTIVVSENLCFAERSQRGAISEQGDPVNALAEGYLGRSTCPRMFGKYKERLAILRQKIERARVDGVIMQNIRFCDLHGSENGIFERDLEAAGIPCLKLEREYGPLVETGRIRMRIEAFLERIS